MNWVLYSEELALQLTKEAGVAMVEYTSLTSASSSHKLCVHFTPASLEALVLRYQPVHFSTTNKEETTKLSLSCARFIYSSSDRSF